MTKVSTFFSDESLDVADVVLKIKVFAAVRGSQVCFSLLPRGTFSHF